MLHKERLEEQRRQMSFLRVVTGNRKTGRKRNKDVAEELEITDQYNNRNLSNETSTKCSEKVLKIHVPNLGYQFRPKRRRIQRKVHFSRFSRITARD